MMNSSNDEVGETFPIHTTDPDLGSVHKYIEETKNKLIEKTNENMELKKMVRELKSKLNDAIHQNQKLRYEYQSLIDSIFQ